MSRKIGYALALVAVVGTLAHVHSAEYTTVAYEPPNGTIYLLSTGTLDGLCTPVTGGMQCIDGDNSILATADGGCGAKSGLASCRVIKRGEEAAVVFASNTLECAAQNYEVSDGGSGICSPNDGVSMTCSQENTSNFASASCDSGCGTTSGTGSCKSTAKSK